jgi:hypothetical protein
MSSRARSRSLRSLSDSPKSRIGWLLARRRLTVSSLDMLKDDSGLGDSVSRATDGDFEVKGEDGCSPAGN